MVDVLDTELQHLGSLFRQLLIQAHGTGKFGGTHAVCVDAEFGKTFLQGRNEAEHADGTGDGGGRRPDLVGGHCNPVTAGGCDAAHGHDYGFACLPRALQFLADDFRGEGTAAAAVDPQNNCFHFFILPRGADQLAQGLTADGAFRMCTIEDRAARHDQRHIALLHCRRPCAMAVIGLCFDVLHFFFVFRVGAKTLDQQANALVARADPVDQTVLQGELGGVALGGLQVGGHIVDKFRQGARFQLAPLLHMVRVLLPERVQPLLVVLTGRVGHVVTGVRFDEIFKGAHFEHMEIDREFVEGVLQIIAVHAHAGKGDAAQFIEMNFVGVAGEKVLLLGVVVGYGDHRFVFRLKALQRLADLLQLAQPATVEGVQLQQNAVDAGVPGGVVNGVHQLAHQRLHRAFIADIQQLRRGRGVGVLVHQNAGGAQQQRRSFRQWRLFWTHNRRDYSDQDKQGDEVEQGGTHPAQAAPEQRENAQRARGFMASRHRRIPRFFEGVATSDWSTWTR